MYEEGIRSLKAFIYKQSRWICEINEDNMDGKRRKHGRNEKPILSVL